MNLLAIDPGNALSAYVVLGDDSAPLAKGKVSNEQMRQILIHPLGIDARIDTVAIEMVACYGMAVGREVFETCLWIGRFQEIAHREFDTHLVYRRDVKMHLCGNARAKDPNIRQALLDRYGPGKEMAIGTKKAPGPLYGFAGDTWAALALAVTFHDKHTGIRAVGGATNAGLFVSR